MDPVIHCRFGAVTGSGLRRPDREEEPMQTAILAVVIYPRCVAPAAVMPVLHAPAPYRLVAQNSCGELTPEAPAQAPDGSTVLLLPIQPQSAAGSAYRMPIV